jgi:hypothetical protein
MTKRWSAADVAKLNLKTNIGPELHMDEAKLKYSNVKVTTDGHKFDSRIESNFYGLLKINRFEFSMKESFVIQEAFNYCGELVREIKIVPDFIIKKEGRMIAIIDTKGMITEMAKLKYKLLKAKLIDQVPIFMPTNNSETHQVINKLLYLRDL